MTSQWLGPSDDEEAPVPAKHRAQAMGYGLMNELRFALPFKIVLIQFFNKLKGNQLAGTIFMLGGFAAIVVQHMRDTFSHFCRNESKLNSKYEELRFEKR